MACYRDSFTFYMKTYEGVEVNLHPFLTSALGGEWLASCVFLPGLVLGKITTSAPGEAV
jgi:hypothetical protein